MSRKYPLSKEEMSLYLACTLNSGRNNAYLVGWSMELPVTGENREDTKKRLSEATGKVFKKHRIFSARIGQDEDGNLWKYDSGEDAVIEYVKTDRDDPAPEDYYENMDLNGGRLYRLLIVDAPSAVWIFTIFHHIVMDGTTRQNMVRDYEEAFQGKEIGEADLSPYEFAVSEREQEKSDLFASDRSYFQELLSGIENLPPEPDVFLKQESFSQFFYPFDRVDASKIGEKKAASGVRTSTIFIGAAGYTLALFSGLESSLVASVTSGRTQKIQKSAGMFVRTVPILCRIGEDRKVDEYLKDLDNQTTQGREHSLYTYLDMNQELGLVLPIAFAYQGDMIADHVEFDGEERRMGFLRANESEYEMRLYLWRKNGKYVFEAVYRSDHYSRAFMDSLAETMEQVLTELLTRDSLFEIQAVSPHQLDAMDKWNHTEKAYPVTDVVSMFREAVKDHPDRTAVIFRDRKLSYSEVDDISERVAVYLRSKGIGRGSAVSMLIHRSSFMVTATLGVLKAGAAYQPLDPTYPVERLDFMMEDADTALLIADQDLLESVPDYKGPVLLTKDIPGLPSVERLTDHPDPEDLFILLYTSGSTGKPKGVMLEHRNLANFCYWYREYSDMDENSIASAYASFVFDCHQLDLYPALTAGACVCIMEEEIRLDLMAMEKRFNELGITHSFMTTQVGRQFYTLSNVESLKFFSVAGEKLVPVQPGEGNTRLYNCYGPTECTIYATGCQVEHNTNRVPIGSPLSNYKCYVVDRTMRRLPVFAPGELLISGAGVGRGYLNRPDLTEKAFAPNPFETAEGYGRIYHTGDIARLMSGGSYDFIGRNDGQVKIRGYRIELAEVESVLREYPGITDACTNTKDMGENGKAVAAYIVSDEKVDIEELKRFILERKPAYMVPSWIMQIDSIPLNQNGKVNRRMLPEPAASGSDTDGEGSKRETVRTCDNILEEELRAEIEKITENHSISYMTPLSQEGLTSIGVIKLSAFVYKKFGVSISTERFKAISLMELENEILSAWMNGNAEKSSDVPAETRRDYPLSAVQQAVYYDAMKNSADTVYNVPVCLRFEDIDGKRLSSACVQAIRAHGYLNTVFDIKDGNLSQEVLDAEPEVKYIKQSYDEFEEYKKSFIRPFRLSTGPLYRFAVIETDNGVFLMFDIHHLIFDGFSMGILLGDIGRAYIGEDLSGEKTTYLDYVTEDVRYTDSGSYHDADRYYEEMLSAFDAPSDIQPDLSGEPEEGKLSVTESIIEADIVDRYCNEKGLSHSALFLSASLYVLSRFTASKDVLISTISAGRSDPRFAETVGMFVHTIPLAMSFKGDRTAAEVISESAQMLAGSIAHEEYPMAELAAKYGFFTNIMYECQLGIVNEGGELGGKAYTYIPMRLDTPKFRISIRITQKGKDYSIEVRYNDALYSQDYMQVLADAIGICLGRMLSSPEESINGLSLLTEEERQRVEGFAMTDSGELPVGLLHRAFEKTANELPDRIALIATDRTLKFKELNEEADRIASKLAYTGKGIGRGDTVLLLLSRKSTYFTALFGVLKTGAAFVPCDPEYPVDRILYTFNDSKAVLIITEKDKLSHFPGHSAVDIEELLTGEDPAAGADKGGGRPDPDITPDDLAYIIYTSGSTGRPKGVKLTHRGITNYCTPTEANILYDPAKNDYSRVLSVTTVSFDMSLKDTVGMLLNGKTVIFADEQQMNDPRALTGLFHETKADVFSATPSRILQYMEYEPFSEALSKCRLIIAGAEQYPEKLLTKLKSLGNIRLLNSYGPTEITVSSNMADLTDAKTVTVGKPLYNYREWIVDTDGNRLPALVTGELLIGGYGVSAGYVGLPEKTAESFIEYEGERVYRTGDLAKWDRYGNVVILGRKDSQVKIRGLRVELTEISEIMEKLPGIKRAVCVVKKLNGEDNLCAYYTAEGRVDCKEIHDSLSTMLTKYMVPTAFTQLESIPVTRNGKIDLNSLPEPELFAAGEYASPANETERYFCELFGTILKTEKVGALDDFFQIGGTSLSATRIMIEASDKGYSLSYGDVFKYKTPRGLASLFTDSQSDTSSGDQSRFKDYDYSAIEGLLGKNTLESFASGDRRKIGNVLLTGATGFMGMHVLAEFLRSEEGIIWCFVRRGRYDDPMLRLKNMLYYYFENEFEDCLDRIRAVDGDVMRYDAFEALEGEDISTVFNCAASVKHFSSGTDIEDINVGGAQNCVRFAKKKGIRLIHFSTLSVAGVKHPTDLAADEVLSEQSFYFGQILDNQYVVSKLISERVVLEAAATQGVDAKVIRVGTLAPRESDGEFQINILSNSFMERLRSYALLKCFPYSRMNSAMRLGAIDSSAAAFLKLAQTPRENCLFHAVNNHLVPTVDVIRIMQERGFDISCVEDTEFSKALTEAEKDPRKAAILSSFLAYNRKIPTVPVPVECEFTSQVLSRLGFFWNMPDREYIRRFINGISELGFFDEENLIR
ncbi:MAG: amino acid adenylation domain-containing protein [Lachnospiraceae bacterium]|nr:amino acid adenylation domain-containing protein [Lachnospiraceae bacterium]